MCGIAGYFSKHAMPDNLIASMTDCMAYRGPDANGFYNNSSKTVALGHRRLSIIDLSSAANQPMYSHCGKYVVVFNGEIFNYQEIARQLNISFKTHSDTEVILEAFIRYGCNFVNLLNGMFAISIYSIEKHELYLFRDRLGVKPIFIAQIDNCIYYGSELKAITKAVQKSQLSINHEAVFQFLNQGYIAQPHSIYNEIKKFPAGTFAKITENNIEISAYWSAEEKIEPQAFNNFNDTKEKLKELLLSSVKYRMIADVPFGTFLSGGIDSSLVTALAQKNSSTAVKTFSIGFKEAKHNEAPFANNVSKYLGTEHHEFMVTEHDALALIDKIILAYDEPYADASAMPTMLVSKLARQHVTMTLSGDGGDELFLGYGMYDWAMRLNNPVFKYSRKLISVASKIMPLKYERAGLMFNYSAQEDKHKHIFSQDQYFFSTGELSALLLPKIKSPTVDNKWSYKAKRTLNAAEEQALYDINFYLKDDLLVKVDRASMQFSLETRTPFLDYRVVEFALNVPYEFKVKNNVSKHILKEVLYDFVPRSYFERPKWGFSVPLQKWLLNDLKSLVQSTLTQINIESAGLVQWTEVDRILKEFYKGKGYYFNRVWALYVLHKWYMHHNAQK